MNRHYRILELDKILARLAERASGADAKTAAGEIVPSSDINTVKRLQNETLEAYKRTAKFGAPSFGGLRNIQNQLKRAESGGVLSMPELLDVCSVLRVVRHLADWAKNAERDSMQTLAVYFDAVSPNKYLEDLISGAILSEDTMSDRASPELAEIRRKIRRCGERAREHLEKLVRSSSGQKYLQDALVTMRDERFVVPVKAEHRGEVPGLVHDTSASGATVFIEPMAVVEYNNEIKLLKAHEQAEIQRILALLSAETGNFADSLQISAQCACELDLIFAKAHLAYDMKATEPVISDDGIIDIKRARHPLLDPKSVVPIDVCLGKNYSTLVITGPNTGGKTVTLKTIGLLTLMAMCGLMIPAADESHISVFQHVLADIGDEQSIEQSLSTFSSHIKNIVPIFDLASESSLILMDELGAGTDPVEGAALAIAILEDLRGKGAKIAATTHYAELKAYALDTAGVENASCEFDVETLQPTYRLLVGIPGRSNAFAISSRLGISKSVIDHAKAQLSGETRRFEGVVRSLETARKSLEAEKEKAAELRIQLADANERYQADREAFEKERTAILEKARKDALDLMDRARFQSGTLLNELEDMKKKITGENAAELLQKARSAMKSGMQALEKTADPVQHKTQVKYALPRPLEKGDEVIIVDLDKQAQVLEKPDSSGQVLVSFGLIKTRVSTENLRLLEKSARKPSQPKTRTVRGVESRASREVVTELDLRGRNADEAIMDLDAFLDSSVMAGINIVRIIHGKGTGVLRTAVQQHLKRHPHVRTRRLGVFGEGGDGVTVAELK